MFQAENLNHGRRLAHAHEGAVAAARDALRVTIAAETARGYLKSIFVKTGTGRQSALVAALLADPILRLPADARTGDGLADSSAS